MATFILKSLVTGYLIIAITSLIVLKGEFLGALLIPIVAWPALLIVSGLSGLVYKAIEEQKNNN